MNIGQAAQASGLPSKTIRFYEEIGLLVPERQAGNGYRVYSMADIETLRFLQRARAVGFSIEECRQLLEVYRNPEVRDAQVHQLLSDYVQRLDQQFIALNSMRANLQELLDQCVLNPASSRTLPEAGSQPPRMAFTLIDFGGD
jgi:MerR family copper efflux transcriptional regulator